MSLTISRTEHGEHGGFSVVNKETASAFEYCKNIVRKHAKSFYFCGHFLPFEKRMAMFAIYSLCRALDDVADNPESDNREQTRASLNRWREKLDLLYSGADGNEPIFVAMRAVLARHPIRKEIFLDLIAGIETDLDYCRFETFEELRLYCYRVASTVGLMSSEVFGYSSIDALPRAEALGIAMQLTNILRDVGEDLRAGRIYLPAEDLRAFDYAEEDLRAGRIDDRFVRLMKFEIERARSYYKEADEGIKLLEPDSRLTTLAASRLYGGILERIEDNGYDVFTRRASLSLAAKIGRLPGIWLTRMTRFNG